MPDPRPKVLCMVDLSLVPEVRAILDQALDVDYQPSSRPVLLETIGDYDALWGHMELKVDAQVLARAPKLKVICTATTGTDHIDKEEAARRGIRVLSITRDYRLLDTFTATAECAWMLMIGCHRHLRAATKAVFEGEWRCENLFGTQLSQRTLGVLGIGRLGKMVVEYGKAFRMAVLGCDLKDFAIPGIERVDFASLLAESDAISIHIHMEPRNYHLFNDETFAQMKDGAILVNTSRGDIIDEAALIRALDSGKLAAYGTDVLHNEWRADMRTSPVVQYAMTHENVVITPHIGGCTYDSLRNARVFAARKLVHFLQTGQELMMP